MALPKFASYRGIQSIHVRPACMPGKTSCYHSSQWNHSRRCFTSHCPYSLSASVRSSKRVSTTTSSTSSSRLLSSPSSYPRRLASSDATSPTSSSSSSSLSTSPLPADWEDDPAHMGEIYRLPNKDFGRNQLMETNEEFKRSLKQILRMFPPLSHAFAYGSGVFPQSNASVSRMTSSPHPHPPEAILKWQKGGGKMIDFIFATKFSPHFHSLNLRRHPNHYSFLRYFGSDLVSYVQDNFGAGAYFNPYIDANGTLIKYGVVNTEALRRDLTDWDTLYLAGRLQKPVKLLIEDPAIVYANQRNLVGAVRCTLLLLGPSFTETEFYATLASLSYRGDPRMTLRSENPDKISNIVTHQLTNFRYLYAPLIESLPNIVYNDSRQKQADWKDDASLDLRMEQDMDPLRRANTLRRLPKAFRKRLYFLYQRKFQIPGGEFKRMLEEAKDEDEMGGVRRPIATPFDVRIAGESDLGVMVGRAVKQTVQWPSGVQTVKSFFTAGPTRSWRYVQEKRTKARGGANS